jgi:hypothetical protein
LHGFGWWGWLLGLDGLGVVVVVVVVDGVSLFPHLNGSDDTGVAWIVTVQVNLTFSSCVKWTWAWQKDWHVNHSETY